MARVIAAQKYRDKTPRWLWALETDCKHTHYELVSEFREQPTRVMCRVCAAEARLARCRAVQATQQNSLVRPVGSPSVLSGPMPEGVEEPFVLNGGMALSQGPAVLEVAAAQPAEGAVRGPLPSCMQPRPGIRPPGTVPGQVRQASEGRGKPKPKGSPAGRRRKAGNTDQGMLFEAGPGLGKRR